MTLEVRVGLNQKVSTDSVGVTPAIDGAIKPNGLNLEGDRSCPMEGMGRRPPPEECPNNPQINKTTYSPRICRQCFDGDDQVWEVAKQPLPLIYAEYKQTGEKALLDNPQHVLERRKRFGF